MLYASRLSWEHIIWNDLVVSHVVRSRVKIYAAPNRFVKKEPESRSQSWCD